MRVSYSPDYYVELPPDHPFPMGKFPAFKQILLSEGLIQEQDMVEPEEASWATLELVHTPDYLRQLRDGEMSRSAERRMGLPWSPALVRRSRLAVQGTANAAQMALADGIAANLAGGTHHAFPDHAEGFCVLNDVAIAIRLLQRQGQIERALIIDLDVHQGNGTAAALPAGSGAFTFSMHGARNYPFDKESSSLDVPLEDGLTDEDYLSELEHHLPSVLDRARAEIVFYLAGVDLAAGDRYGRLALTRAGLHRRDHTVLQAVREHGAATVLLMSGGYASTPEETADLHAIVHREARTVFSTPTSKYTGRATHVGELASQGGLSP